jgi:hypothetical protein
MPPFQRRLAEPDNTRGSIRPRQPADSVDTLCFGRHPMVHGRQPVLKHGPIKQRGVLRPSVRIYEFLITDTNPVPLLTINPEESLKATVA